MLERHRKNYELRGSRRGVTFEFSEFFSTGFPCALPRMPINHRNKCSIAFLHKENSEGARNSIRELAFLFRNSSPKKCTLNLRNGCSQEIKPIEAVLVGDVSARKSLPFVLYHRKLHTILADSVLRLYFITEKSDMANDRYIGELLL